MNNSVKQEIKFKITELKSLNFTWEGWDNSKHNEQKKIGGQHFKIIV